MCDRIIKQKKRDISPGSSMVVLKGKVLVSSLLLFPYFKDRFVFFIFYFMEQQTPTNTTHTQQTEHNSASVFIRRKVKKTKQKSPLFFFILLLLRKCVSYFLSGCERDKRTIKILLFKNILKFLFCGTTHEKLKEDPVLPRPEIDPFF